MTKLTLSCSKVNHFPKQWRFNEGREDRAPPCLATTGQNVKFKNIYKIAVNVGYQTDPVELLELSKAPRFAVGFIPDSSSGVLLPKPPFAWLQTC